MDDIFVCGTSDEEHEKRLQSTLRTIHEAGLVLNTEKCLLRQNQLCYLGHFIDKEGICTEKAKIEAISLLEPLRGHAATQ